MQLIIYLGRLSALLLFLLQISCGSDSNNSIIDTDKTADSVSGVCNNINQGINWSALKETRCHLLSDYGLFKGLPNTVSNSIGGIHYKLGSELFSDYARKYRYIYLPDGSKLTYQNQNTIGFPVGTVLVKVFALPDVSTDILSERIIEVRLMVLRENGWIFIPYAWDEDIQDGRLAIGGSSTAVNFKHNGKQLEFNYESPSLFRCESCHQVLNDKKITFLPIGPKVHHLNQTISIDANEVNQLEYWQELGLIDLPDNTLLPFAPDWRDNSQDLQQRAKAYLDINCAHCHNPQGAAALSGLRLEYTRTNLDHSHGICNSSHGWRGGGFDIWPGRGDESSIPKRMELDGATDRMPPIGRAVSDDEAIALIREWIDSMPEVQCSS